MSGAPARRRAAALETTRPGAAPPPSRPLAATNPAAKALTKEELAAYAQQRKAEREREREERAAQLRATKLAAASKQAGDGAPSSWNPAGGSTSAATHARRPRQATGRVSQGSQAGSQPAPHPAASSSSSGASVSGGKEGRRSISSAAPGREAAAAEPPAAASCTALQGSGEPAQQQQQQQQQPALLVEGSSSSLKGGSGGGGLPAGAATARSAVAARPAADSGAEMDSAELEARRTQQMVDWGALLVQCTAVMAAERLLLGPAAPPDTAPPSAEQLPLSFGVRPPAEPAARCTAVQAQVAAALEALEQQRQLKLQMAAAEGLSEADRRLLEAEAAADLQAQALLAHWGTQAACEARVQQQEGSDWH
ncbi:hypothetical protein C2E21_9384 [Chlorella sorokiniana]|uniref:Uncharacterized protein n=1 Tax=Chlorella sorokiniana TaxID=3076 RepID=A0A2P6TBL0_CHLSO|nr:hypothetical protein C2E21_9384 [Chlorella sorokiniana]|eukprot:PRW05926.1 hypothetical protein C2E21_9384 [Chlorella sorokiniana]